VDFDRSRTARSRRLFTAAEANALLAEIAPVIASMRDAAQTGTRAGKIVQELALKLEASGGGRPDQQEIAAQRELAASIEQLRAALETLDHLGIRVKDPGRGLIDFPSDRNGEVVELCWLDGEPAVAHWHRVGEGFAGRRPLREEDA
jgi:hypothetical protein